MASQVYERFYENFHVTQRLGPLAGLSWGVRHVAAFFVWQYSRLMLYFQGTGRYAPDELKRLRREAVGTLADYAGAAMAKAAGGASEPFWILGGEQPTEADFTLFGYLANMCYSSGPQVSSPFRLGDGELTSRCRNPFTTDLVRQHKPLVSYVERIHRKYFPDFKDPL